MDIIEAKRNLEVLEKNRSRLMNYNHLYSSYAFKEMCGAELRKVNKQIHSIEAVSYTHLTLPTIYSV